MVKKRLLFVPWYNSKDPKRAAELEQAARINIDYGVFDEVYYVSEEHKVPTGARMIGVPHRPTYSDMATIASQFANPEDLVVFANADISFDMTLHHLNPSKAEAYALSRWEPSGLRDKADSQDAWIFKGAPKLRGADFYFGVAGCDNSILYEMARAGYVVRNPARTVVARHHHDSEVRTYKMRHVAQHSKDPKEYPKPPFRFLEPSYLRPRALIGTKVLHIGFRREHGCFSKAFEELGCDVTSVYWQESSSVDVDVALAAKEGQHLVFMQTHNGGIVSDALLSRLTGFRVNWCGDVRLVRPAWFLPTARVVDVTAFSNVEDMAGLPGGKWLGDNYDPAVYYPQEEAKRYAVAFMGNHYPRAGFQETDERLRMVKALRAKYGDSFALCGRGWPEELKAMDLFDDVHAQARIYRQSVCAVNQAHFHRTRYYSDRLFRIMGCGTPCFSKTAPGMEQDFVAGTHYIPWTTIPELLAKIEKTPDALLASVGAAGQREVLANHTTRARCLTVLGWAKLLTSEAMFGVAPRLSPILPGSSVAAPKREVSKSTQARIAGLRRARRNRMTSVT